MADEKSTGLDPVERPTTYDEDERDQATVLRQVLEHHPAVTFTRAELTRELTGGGLLHSGIDADGMERAVRELAGTGLLHAPCGEDGLLRPTRTAVRYFELSGGGF